jgi:hypothetical protein
MRIARMVLAAVLALLGIGVISAGPAQARPVDPPMYGIYTFHQDGAPDEIWTIYATCVVAGCVLHVSTMISTSLGPDSDTPPFGGDARKAEGLWTMNVVKDKGIRCDDGSWSPTSVTYRWDQESLQGTMTDLIAPSNACGLQPSMTKKPFTLVYKEELPIPIILDPLNQIENLW